MRRHILCAVLALVAAEGGDRPESRASDPPSPQPRPAALGALAPPVASTLTGPATRQGWAPSDVAPLVLHGRKLSEVTPPSPPLQPMTLLMTTTASVNHAYDSNWLHLNLDSASSQQMEGNYAVFDSLGSDACASLSTMVSNGWYISCDTSGSQKYKCAPGHSGSSYWKFGCMGGVGCSSLNVQQDIFGAAEGAAYGDRTVRIYMSTYTPRPPPAAPSPTLPPSPPPLPPVTPTAFVATVRV